MKLRLLLGGLVACAVQGFSPSFRTARMRTTMMTADSNRRSFVSIAGASLGFVGVSPSLAATKGREYTLERAKKYVRKLAGVLEELQEDLFDEEWDYVAEYPQEIRSFVPAFTKYTDSAYPSDSEIDKSTRFALRYEVGRLFGGVAALQQAAKTKDFKAASSAYSTIAVAYDRYLKAGGLIDGVDPASVTIETPQRPKKKPVNSPAPAQKPAPKPAPKQAPRPKSEPKSAPKKAPPGKASAVLPAPVAGVDYSDEAPLIKDQVDSRSRISCCARTRLTKRAKNSLAFTIGHSHQRA